MTRPKVILGIETSCDETAAAVVEISAYDKPLVDKGVIILSNIVASSADLQAKYGGVIPEQAAREQIKSIIPVIEEALRLASLAQGKQSLDAIAVTQGPGLIGSLLVGIETAKTLALVWGKPLIPVNHLLGHFYANWIWEESRVQSQESRNKKEKSSLSTLATSHLPKFPCIGLLVSGGHTDLVLFGDHGKYEYLGGTRDDAAGECFDKCARLLGLPYPGGPNLAKLAKSGNPNAFNLPRPMMKDFSSRGRPTYGWDFSFSGLKTAVANLVQSSELVVGSKDKNSTNYKLITNNLAASIEAAIVDVLVEKTVRAAQRYKVDQIMIAGGVASNQKLVSDLKFKIQSSKFKIRLHVPASKLCTDNAAMIASTAFYNYHPIDPLTLQANPNLSLVQ